MKKPTDTCIEMIVNFFNLTKSVSIPKDQIIECILVKFTDEEKLQLLNKVALSVDVMKVNEGLRLMFTDNMQELIKQILDKY